MYNIEYYKDIDFFDNSKDEPKDNDNVGRLKVKNNRLTEFVSVKTDEISESHNFQLETPDLSAFQLEVVYPGLLIGTGLPHSFGGKGEAALGLCLDYVTGMPYIPGSSVKGMLRSAFMHEDYIKECLGNQKVNIENLDVENFEEQIFGKRHNDRGNQEGSDIFFDAVIVLGDNNRKIIDTDFITPHRSNKELLELASPNPITMIKVRPGVVFCFQFKLTVYNDSITAEKKLELFKQILIDLGIGAKTNVGFGLLQEVSDEDIAKRKSASNNNEAVCDESSASEITKISDLKKGMIVSAKITQVVSYGAFADIIPNVNGKKVSGLIHISKIANHRIEDVNDYLQCGQVVKIKVLEIEPKLRFSMKDVD